MSTDNNNNGKVVAINNLRMGQFMVQNGLTVADVRQAFGKAKAAMDKVDPAFATRFAAILSQYDKVRGYPKDVAKFTDERAELTRGFAEAIKVAEAMDASVWVTVAAKQPNKVTWKGVERVCNELAAELAEPWVKSITDKLDNPDDDLRKLLGAIARAFYNARPAKDDDDDE